MHNTGDFYVKAQSESKEDLWETENIPDLTAEYPAIADLPYNDKYVTGKLDK